MIACKKNIITGCFIIMLPLSVWAEAPVVDDSDNFATQGQQHAGRPKYDEPQANELSRSNDYSMDAMPDEGPALAQEDVSDSKPSLGINDGAKLIDKLQILQKELQELRGQLEVQAHDLKLLQQQQLTFYKDLDARIAGASGSKLGATATDLSNLPAAASATAIVVPAAVANSRANPADEQISYLAAYEQIKSKHYDNAINAMQAFVQKYPNGGYSANAEYWLGELFLVKKEYTKALEHFEIVMQRFPSSTKLAASQLKAGYAFIALGNNNEAKKHFQEVVRTYPGTPTARLANAKLETIR